MARTARTGRIVRLSQQTVARNDPQSLNQGDSQRASYVGASLHPSMHSITLDKSF